MQQRSPAAWIYSDRKASLCYQSSRESFSCMGDANFFIGERKIQKLQCDMGRIFLYLMKSTDVQVGCSCTSWPGKQASTLLVLCSHVFCTHMSVAWHSLFKVISGLKMLGSSWVKVLGRWCKVSSGGPARWSPVQGGHLLGPSPAPEAKSLRRPQVVWQGLSS